MKEKILAELKKKFPGLQTEFLGFIAGKLTAKVTEETQIEGAITELDTILPIKEQADFFQSESDRRVTAAKAKFEAENKKDDKKEDKKDDQPKGDPKVPEELKSIFETIGSLKEKLDNMEKEKKTSGLTEKLKSKLAEKKIPLKFADRRTIESEEQLEAVLAEVEADFEEVKQELANEGFRSSAPPRSTGGANKLASKEEADLVVNSII